MEENARSNKILNTAVIVAALGYFVDIYDLLLFGFVRVRSLSDLGYSGQELTDVGISLLNWQMGGMLIGGVLWGILGDRLGRISVLYYSILMYSAANILNGFVHSGESYALYRFIAGIGLAGELGAGITLVSEVLPKEKRGYGTMLVACIGLSGALLAWVINHFFSWQTCYFIGGGMGFLLLGLRLKVNESGIFERVRQNTAIRKGDFLSLFAKRERFVRFARCLFVGAPTWFVVGILVTLAPEFGAAKGLGNISAANAIASCYAGLILGDIASGLLSQFWRSRLKVMAFFLSLDALAIANYLYAGFTTPGSMYFAHFLLGFSVGFWVIFVTIGAEQFGANLRATVATSVPNFARGLLVPIAASFRWLKGPDGLGDLTAAATVVGAVCLLIAFASLYGMQETFDKDLNYVET